MHNKLKGYSFYVDFGDFENLDNKTNPKKREFTRKKLKEYQGFINCIAIYDIKDVVSLMLTGCYDGYCAVTMIDNADVGGTLVNPEYLRKNCTKISQELTKKLHPNLIKYLEYEPE